MKQFTQNNIDFRIVSSNAIASFKASQAFDFNEVVKNKKNFNPAAREVLLLLYDYWFRFLMRTEKLFLFLDENEPPQILIPQLIGNAKYLMEEVEDVLLSHEDLFDNDLVGFVKNYHSFTFKIIQFFITEHLEEGKTVYRAYPFLVQLISMYLQLMLFSLYEFDNNIIQRHEPFLSYTLVCEKVIEAGVCVNPLVERAKFYFDKFKITNFVVKNYVKDSQYLKHCIEECHKNNINIIRIDEMF